jgi:anti-sigma regulatory factor (Ser/Thr protein kinase)
LEIAHDGAAVELFLTRDPASVGRARHTVERELRDACFADDVVDAARVLVSELVTNALQHGQGAPFLCVEHGRRKVRVEVGDDGPTLELLDHPESGGFGLKLLDAFASRWGLQSTREDGKKVWFELVDVTQGAASG